MVYRIRRKIILKIYCLCIVLRKVSDTIKLESILNFDYTFGPWFCNFVPLFTKSIWNAISSASFFVLIEGLPTPSFKNQTVIRQCNPLSPILFDIFMDILSKLIERKVSKTKKELKVQAVYLKVSKYIFFDRIKFFHYEIDLDRMPGWLDYK